MWTVYEALSLGWSLTGNQVDATCGSPTTTEPSSVLNQPFEPSTGSSIVVGIPSYRIRVTNQSPFGRPFFGVTINSWPFRRHFASWPSTLTERTVSPEKSRSNRDRSCVARDVIVATPLSWSVAGS